MLWTVSAQAGVKVLLAGENVTKVEALSLFPEGHKMGMIAFYAGLFIGILFGFLFSSGLVYFRVKPDSGELTDPAKGYSQVDPLKP